MLTVKHIRPNCEMVRLASEVRLARESVLGNPGSPDGPILRVYADLDGIGTHCFEDGTVYVMNDAGATVAKYVFSAWAPAAA
jgi:hypothetical protein